MKPLEQRLIDALYEANGTGSGYEDVAMICRDIAREAWRSGFVRCMMEFQREEHESPVDSKVFPPSAQEWIESKL